MRRKDGWKPISWADSTTGDEPLGKNPMRFVCLQSRPYLFAAGCMLRLCGCRPGDTVHFCISPFSSDAGKCYVKEV